MPEQSLNLLQLAASFAAEFGTSAAQVMRAEMTDPSRISGSDYHSPNRPRAIGKNCFRAMKSCGGTGNWLRCSAIRQTE